MTARARWRRSPRGGSPASRSRASSASRNSGACRCSSTTATLVPRPETETVVEAALAAIDRDGPRTRPLRIADLGTGSGAFLLALSTELPNAIGIGTDISREALAVARDNAGRLGLARARAIRACDFGAALAGRFRSRRQQSALYRERRHRDACRPKSRHDPRRALDGGADGLACYRTIAGQAPRLLKPDGHLVVELGIGQEAAVAGTVRSARACIRRPRAPIFQASRAPCMRVLPQ